MYCYDRQTKSTAQDTIENLQCELKMNVRKKYKDHNGIKELLKKKTKNKQWSKISFFSKLYQK